MFVVRPPRSREWLFNGKIAAFADNLLGETALKTSEVWRSEFSDTLSDAQVGLAHVFVFGYFMGWSFQLDPAVSQHVGIVTDGQCHLDVLLHQ